MEADARPHMTAANIRKYSLGGTFATLHELTDWLAEGGWVYWHDKPKHPLILEHQQLATLRACLPSFRKAMPGPWA